MNDFWNRPCAAQGLTSYRYEGAYGWIMIGARDIADALKEAARSTGKQCHAARLQQWDYDFDCYRPA